MGEIYSANNIGTLKILLKDNNFISEIHNPYAALATNSTFQNNNPSNLIIGVSSDHLISTGSEVTAHIENLVSGDIDTVSILAKSSGGDILISDPLQILFRYRSRLSDNYKLYILTYYTASTQTPKLTLYYTDDLRNVIWLVDNENKTGTVNANGAFGINASKRICP